VESARPRRRASQLPLLGQWEHAAAVNCLPIDPMAYRISGFAGTRERDASPHACA
jgi:hypothetical protein